MKNCILVIEDDPLVREMIVSLLRDDGYSVLVSQNAGTVAKKMEGERFDAVLLDVQLPDGNGLELISKIRSQTTAPIIIMSGRTATGDKIIGLEMGADDYIGKPFQPREMVARIKAHIRRYHASYKGSLSMPKIRPVPERIAFGDFILDRMQLQVFDLNNKPLNLTIREFRLVETLVMAPRQVHSREYLLNTVRGDNLDITDRAIDVQFLRIRRKLGDKPGPQQLIKAVRSIGYMLGCETVAL